MVETDIYIKWSSNIKAPLIILFGWAGCHDRYLSKYSNIYETKNLSILRFIVPISEVNSYSSYRKFAIKIYEKIFSYQLSEINFSIIFHLFSMNGCSLFSSLWTVLDTFSNGNIVKQAVRGIIFDSCPANVMPWQAAEALSFASMHSSKYSVVQRMCYRFFLTGLFSIYRIFIWLHSNFESGVYERHFSYFDLLKFKDLPLHQLYLFSNKDRICSASSIIYFQTIQLKRTNIHLKSKCWKDSLHVEHLRKYPTEYTNECLNFVNRFF